MKKNQYILLVLPIMISHFLIHAKVTHEKEAASKKIVNEPKKIRIKTFKQPHMTVKNEKSTVSIMQEPIAPNIEKVVLDKHTSNLTAEFQVSRVEKELEQELLTMYKNAGKIDKKIVLGTAIEQLSNTVEQQQTLLAKNHIKETSQVIQDISLNSEVEKVAYGPDQKPGQITAHVDVPDTKTTEINDNIEAHHAPVVITEAPQPERKRLYLGRAYNYAVIEEEEEKRFVVPTSIWAAFALRGFDNCQREVPLANILINSSRINNGLFIGPNGLETGNFTVGDIFLEARLSARIVGTPEEDKSILFLDTNGPGNFLADGITPAQFGNRRRQQYLGLLAPVEVHLNTDVFCLAAQSGFIYRFYLDECEKVAGAVGIIVPVISKFQNTCFRLEKGKLYDRVEFAAKDATVREFTIARFFNDFSDLEDFFQRAVLEPKGLSIICKQQRIGIGDITVFGLLDFAPSLCHLDGLQLGINLILPTSNKAIGDTLFEIEVDDGGAFQIEPFANVIFNSGNRFFNPSLYLAGNFSIPFTAQMRVPRLVTHNQVVDNVNAQGLANEANRVTNIPGLIAPVMREFFALSFSELDSLVPEFADTVSTVRLRKGPKVVAGIGNYFYNVFSCNFRFGIFYDFTAQGNSEICSTDCTSGTKYDTSFFGCDSSFAQRIGLNLTYKFSCGELNVGGQFIVAGKNTPKINEAFASFIAVF